jgi:hypothetical protein
LPISGEYAGRLSNSGEHIRLVDAGGETILELTYGTEAPWPLPADGGGPSLEIVDMAGDPGLPENWKASGLDGGSPGIAAP